MSSDPGADPIPIKPSDVPVGGASQKDLYVAVTSVLVFFMHSFSILVVRVT